MSSHVFLSYRHGSDKQYAENLAGCLTRAGLTVWFDPEIVTGERFARVIEGKIATCAAFVVLMSTESADSLWVDLEVDKALAVRCPIFPLLLEGEPFFKLGNRHYTDVRLGDMPPADFVEQLRETVERDDDVVAPRETAPQSDDGALLFGHEKWIQCLAFSPDGNLLASGSADGRVRLWNTADHTPAGVLKGHDGIVTAVAFNASGRLATACSEGVVQVWDAGTGKAAWSKTHSGAVRSIAWHPSGEHLLVAGEDHKLYFRDTKGKSRSVRIDDLDRDGAEILCLTVHPDGKLIATTATTAYHGTYRQSKRAMHQVRIRASKTGKRIGTIKLDDLGCGVLFSPDGRRLATTDDGGAIELWSTRNWTRMAVLKAEWKYVSTFHETNDDDFSTVPLSFTADSRSFVTTLGKKRCAVWDVASGAIGRIFVEPAGPISTAAISPDGRFLATASEHLIRLRTLKPSDI